MVQEPGDVIGVRYSARHVGRVLGRIAGAIGDVAGGVGDENGGKTAKERFHNTFFIGGRLRARHVKRASACPDVLGGSMLRVPYSWSG